ncbi:MAG: Rrf2 family transcriptional regulator [Deltaproteobacteria bacterium]|nr:Rrf2 family transcriptional regulator [Deltaproteobacteria bacterium]
MILPQTAEYALRAMACLAALPPGEGMRALDLSVQASVPAAYLSKILRRLVIAGLLVSKKGHHGGFALARPPRRIHFAEILAAADAGPHVGRCAFGWAQCDPEAPCPLHPAWSKLRASFGEWAQTSTLADIDLANFDQSLPGRRAEAG